MPTAAQRAFGGGEISPSYYSRTDMAKYHASLRTCRNFIVQLDGGVYNRSGTKYIGEVKDSSKTCRLIGFAYNEVITNTYLLEFGDSYIRFYQDGVQVVVSAVSAWADATAYLVGDLASQGGVNYYCTVSHTSAVGTDKPGVDSGAASKWYALTGTIYEIPTTYTEDELMDIQFVQSGNVLTLVHPNHRPVRLTRSTSTKWVLEDIAFGPSIDAPDNVGASGGSAGAIQYWAVTAVKDLTYEESLAEQFSDVDLVPSTSTPTTVTWDQVSGAIGYNIYRSPDGATWGLVGYAGNSETARTDSAWTDTNEVASSAVAGAYVAAAGQCRNDLAPIAATQKSSDGTYRVFFKTTLASGAASTGFTRGRVGIYYKRSSDSARVFSHYKDVWSVLGANQTSTYEWEEVISVPDDGYTSLRIDLVPEVEPATGGSSCSLTCDTATGPSDKVTWSEATGSFIDNGDSPDTAYGFPTQASLFEAGGDYPSVVTMYQQRLLFANTNNNPENIWASKAGIEQNFALAAPVQPDDPVTFRIKNAKASAVKHLADLTRLIVFTAASEFIVWGDDAGTLRPDAQNPKAHSYNGAGSLRPIIINNRALYVQARQSYVRAFRPDDVEGSIGINLSMFATHLFKGYTLVDWDYAAVPDSMLLAVRSDGTLVAMTYIPEYDVWGWHHHDTAGTFENVSVIPEDDEDAIYVVVKRTINGSTKRYIERLQSRQYTTESDAWFVDCGKLYTGVAISSMTGLSHLEGKQVSIFADGDVRASPNNSAYTVRTVSGGSVALGGSYTKVLVGLPFTADLETLDIDMVDNTTMKAQNRLVSNLALTLNRSRGLYVGRPDQPTTPLPLNGLSALPLKAGETTATIISDTRDINVRTKYDNHGRVFIRQVDPLPAEILMIAPSFGANA
jgi:hypothetical protein